MGDRAYCAITVHACPQSKRPRLLRVILDAFGHSREKGERLKLGEPYSVEELLLGGDDELYTEIVEKVGLDGLTFDLQQEPKYEYDGFRHLQVNGLGLYHCAVNSSGTPIISWSEVEPHLSDAEELARVFGRPWFDALTALEAAAQQEQDHAAAYGSP